MVGPGRHRKVALIGSVKQTRELAPWDDVSWEIWAHNSIPPRAIDGRRVDRIFDLHPPHVFQVKQKCGRADYYGWLKRKTIPIYMQDRYPEIPASVRYPIERMQAEWPLVPFGSQTAYMIALALSEGVTHLALYGIHYSAEPERDEQRENAAQWVGIAQGRGVHVVIPKGCPIGRIPAELYGYETHSTPEKYKARQQQFTDWHTKQTETTLPGLKAAVKGFDPSRLRRVPTSEIPPIPERMQAIWAAEGASA